MSILTFNTKKISKRITKTFKNQTVEIILVFFPYLKIAHGPICLINLQFTVLQILLPNGRVVPCIHLIGRHIPVIDVNVVNETDDKQQFYGF